MAGRPRYTAADVPYLLERDATANNAARARIEQRRLARLHDRYKDDEDLELPHYRRTHRGEDLRRVDRGLANYDRDFYPPLEHRHNDLGPLEPGRRGRLYYDPPPYDAADDELEYGRRGRRPNRGPPPYDAADDESIYNDERHDSFRRHGLGNDRLPFHARDVGIRDLDEEAFREISPGLRNPHSRRWLRGSRDMDLDHSTDLGSRVRRGLEPHLDAYDYDFDMGPHGDRHDFGRSGVRAAGRHPTGYRFEDYFEDDDLESNLREVGRTGYRSDLDIRSIDDDLENDFSRELPAPRAAEISHRARRTGNRSDLDFRSVHDDIEDDLTEELRALRPEEMSRRVFLFRIKNELDAEELRERERQEAEIKEKYTEEDIEIEDIERGLRDSHGQMPSTAAPRPAANSSDGDLEDFPRRERHNPIRRPQAGIRQSSRKILRANDDVDRIRVRNPQIPPAYDSVIPAPQTTTRQTRRKYLRANDTIDRSGGRNQQAPPSYDSVTPAQAAAHMQAELANDANHPPVAAAVSDNANPHPVAAAAADTTVKGATEEVPHRRKHAQGPIHDANKESTARDGTGMINKANNLDAAHAAREISADSAHTSRAEVGDDGHSDGLDSGCDTPDENSEDSGAGDDISEGDEVLQSFIHITL